MYILHMGSLTLSPARISYWFLLRLKLALPTHLLFPRTRSLHKQAHVFSAAEMYIDQYPECGDTWQFDVIAVEGNPGDKAQIEHFENVIG